MLQKNQTKISKQSSRTIGNDEHIVISGKNMFSVEYIYDEIYSPNGYVEYEIVDETYYKSVFPNKQKHEETNNFQN